MKGQNTHVFHGFVFKPNPYGTARGWILDAYPADYKGERLPLVLIRTLAKAREYARQKVAA